MKCDKCQSERIERHTLEDQMPLERVLPQLCFDKWAINFVFPFPIQIKRTKTRYIISATKFLTAWAKAKSMKDCTAHTDK